jgi:hypothetical protein
MGPLVSALGSIVRAISRGCVLGRVRRLIQNLVAACACRSCTGWMLASVSATAVATVWKAPVIACAPTICALPNQAAFQASADA